MAWYNPLNWFRAPPAPERDIHCANPQCPDPIITEPEMVYNPESRIITHLGECQIEAEIHAMMREGSFRARMGNYETIDRATALHLIQKGTAIQDLETRASE